MKLAYYLIVMITCHNCGSIDDFSTEQKSNNLVATCNSCGKFIKNIPTEKPAFYVGKYKGKQIDDIDDISYLQWAHDNMNSLNSRQRNAIKERINHLANLLR